MAGSSFKTVGSALLVAEMSANFLQFASHFPAIATDVLTRLGELLRVSAITSPPALFFLPSVSLSLGLALFWISSRVFLQNHHHRTLLFSCKRPCGLTGLGAPSPGVVLSALVVSHDASSSFLLQGKGTDASKSYFYMFSACGISLRQERDNYRTLFGWWGIENDTASGRWVVAQRS